MSFFQTFKQELQTVFGDAAIALTIIGGVVLYAFLYPQPYLAQNVTSIPVSVVDYDHSRLSRAISAKLNATASVDIVQEDTNLLEAKEALLKEKVFAVVVFPKDLEKKLYTHRQPTIEINANNNYFLLFGGVLEGAMKSILTEVGAKKVQSSLISGVPLKFAINSYAPYHLKTINLFNEYNSYTQYVLPAVFVLILQQTLLIGMGIVAGGVRERAYKNYHYNVSVLHVLLSRYIIFGTLFFLHSLFYFGFVFDFFGISHLASGLEIVVLSLVSIFAFLGFGYFLGSFFTSREMATAFVLVSSLPFIFSAGFIWPKEQMALWVVYLSECIPSTSAIFAFLKLNQMGLGAEALHTEVLFLFLQGVFYTVFGYYMYKKRA